MIIIVSHQPPAWISVCVARVSDKVTEPDKHSVERNANKRVSLLHCQLLNQSHLPDLGTRRKHLSLCYFYNIVNGVHVYPNLPLVHHSPQHVLHNTHSFMQFSAHTNHFQHSFFPHVTALWNTLPSTITSAPSLPIFKHCLHSL